MAKNTINWEDIGRNVQDIVDHAISSNDYQKLIQTFDDVLKIQAEGRAKRLAAENEMANMENDLKLKLLEISGQ